MRLAEKIKYLRKKYRYSQQEFAEKLGLTAKAISKWETGSSLPDIENLKMLSKIFHISIDTLIKDELEIDLKKKNHSCHKKPKIKQVSYYEGLLIKESISDENILDYLNMNKVEVWITESIPKYWTAIYFTSNQEDLPEKFSKALISNKKVGNWYVDFKHENTKYIVLKDKILSYTIGNNEEKTKVAQVCQKLGIESIDEIGE